MNAKELERRLAKRGVNANSVVVVVRNLREGFKGGKLPVGGRGPNAHDLTADETAWIVGALAGSEVPARARQTLDRLLKLRARDGKAPADFIACLQLILRREIKQVHEIRICRNADFARIIFEGGSAREFANWRAPAAVPPLFRSEGVLSSGLIEELADSVGTKEDRGFAGDAFEDGPPDV